MAKKKPEAKTQKVESLPVWMSDVMQGICYWMGHRRAYYRHHDLVEGAIVGELANLIHANIGLDDQLSCEVPYKSLIKDFVPGAPYSERLDLLIKEKSASGEEKLTAIEVKRGKAAPSLVLEDIMSLSILKDIRPDISTFVLIVCENKLPTNTPWIAADEDGTSRITANTKIMPMFTGHGHLIGHVKVRRVCKALASLKPKAGHTAILIEVLS